MYRNFIKPIYLVILIVAVSAGCARYKNIVYMQDRLEKIDSTLQSINIAQTDNFVITAGDNLYINLYGTTTLSSEMFNKQTGTNANYSELSLYLQGYMVDDSGYVELPVINKVKVGGLTIAQSQSVLQQKADEYMVGVLVDVRLLSYNVTVIGEVARPGTHTFLKREINLLEALAKAGDVNQFADLRQVLIIRKVGNQAESTVIDLTGSDFYTSSYFWLQPNDVIYVKPLRAKAVNVNATTVSLFISSISLLILVLTFIK